MILSFNCRETERIWQGKLSRKFPAEVQDWAVRKLRQVDASRKIEDLKIPPGNRLEVLKGERADQISVRINDQWRVCLRWVGHDAISSRRRGNGACATRPAKVANSRPARFSIF
jgi:proteic killer suppression protein